MPIESQSKIIAEQLLADLHAKRRNKISLADVRRAVEGRVEGIGYDLATVGSLAYLTFARVLEGLGSREPTAHGIAVKTSQRKGAAFQNTPDRAKEV